jgi:hypothetical protein
MVDRGTDDNVDFSYISSEIFSNSVVLPERILLAESNLARVELFISQAASYRWKPISVGRTAEDIDERMVFDTPDLLLLGSIDNHYWFDLCDTYRQSHPRLPIVVMAELQHVDEYFRRWVKVRGGTEVIPNHPEALNKLFEGLESSFIQTTASITMGAMMTAISEITIFSKAYFGSLVLGNYWRKTYDLLISDLPALKYWSADSFGNISCHSAALDAEFTPEDLHCLRLWVGQFIKECQRSIVNFDALLQKPYLSPQVRQLLPQATSLS